MKNKLPLVLLGSTLGLALLVTLVYYWASFFYQQEHREVYVSVVLKNTDYSNDFWNVLKEGIVVASADYNVKYEIRGPKDERKIEEQLAYLEEAISKKPDAIILAATDFNRLVPLAKEIKEKQIPLIIIDSLINSDDADCKISTDNYEAGSNAGKILLKYLTPGAPVAIFSFIQSCSTAIDRERGIISYLKDKVKILRRSIIKLKSKSLMYEPNSC